MIFPICSVFNSKPVDRRVAAGLVNQTVGIPSPESGVPALFDTPVKFLTSLRLARACNSVSIDTQFNGNKDRAKEDHIPGTPAKPKPEYLRQQR